MTLLYPSVLILFIPLLLLYIRSDKRIVIRVHIIVLMLLILALSRPTIKESLQTVEIEAKDIIIALDVSYSMHATDIAPTRYSFAKETIQSLLHKNPTDNIMLMVFTSNPLLLSPPTTDHKLIEVALQSFNPQFILTKGTSLEKLFTKIHTIQKDQTGHKSLILITDGGEEDSVDVLAQKLEKSNVSLITLALGTKRGTSIKAKNDTLLKDKEGHLIISRINP
ncbi:MAG: VWA domain-containing protein, partial [Campylobacterota bacterium]|nr:VWA domain-containing protein [Campylobacterota bacterium]